jgi:hypothetical protein
MCEIPYEPAPDDEPIDLEAREEDDQEQDRIDQEIVEANARDNLYDAELRRVVDNELPRLLELNQHRDMQRNAVEWLNGRVLRGNPPEAELAEVLQPGPDSEPTETEPLSMNARIRTTNVERVTRIGEKLVFVLTGNANDTVIVKFEMPGSRESIPHFAQRQEVTQKLARHVFDAAPEAKRLDQQELQALRELDVEGSESLHRVLTETHGGQGLTELSIALKIQYVEVGESLLDMIEGGRVSRKVIWSQNVKQLGKMAFFDLLVGNVDRFHEPRGISPTRQYYVEPENLDFRTTEEGRLEAVPLDNLSPEDRLSMSIDVFAEHEGRWIRNAEARQNYAQDAILRFLEEIRLDARIQEVPELQRWFAQGMELAVKLTKEWVAALKPMELSRNPTLRALVDRIAQIEAAEPEQ